MTAARDRRLAQAAGAALGAIALALKSQGIDEVAWVVMSAALAIATGQVEIACSLRRKRRKTRQKARSQDERR